SDAIFAVFVEELGFIGAIFLISLFLFLITRALTIARQSPDYQGKILAMGIVGLLSLQILFNLASNVALVPLTGVPLPFISYGGSSLFVTMSAIGILLNIKRQG
ncbi:MAG: Stage V sporulation protein E, partial [Candidatus Curtissbacteria bacterium GW2011_GWC2_38_9]